MDWVIRLRINGKYLYGFRCDGSPILTGHRQNAWRFPSWGEAQKTLATSIIAGAAFIAPLF